MNTTTQPSTPSPKLQLTFNKKTLEIHMELTLYSPQSAHQPAWPELPLRHGKATC